MWKPFTPKFLICAVIIGTIYLFHFRLDFMTSSLTAGHNAKLFGLILLPFLADQHENGAVDEAVQRKYPVPHWNNIFFFFLK